jgi:hypothetical protein
MDSAGVDALAVVRFYSMNWRLLGTKGTKGPPDEPFPSSLSLSRRGPAGSCAGAFAFLSTLERAASIDKNLLDGSLALEEFGAAIRMKWASRCQTTRIEDRALLFNGSFRGKYTSSLWRGYKGFHSVAKSHFCLVRNPQSICDLFDVC